MSITAGQDIVASDFINASSANATPASDSGRVAKLESDGKISTRWLKFGGDGSDGALSVTSGTTTIDLGSAQYVVKNYTSLSVTGTGKIAFSNPHTNGTIIIFRVLGNVTLTSSTSPCLDASGMGAAGGAGGTGTGGNGTTGNIGTDMLGSELVSGGGAADAGGVAGVIFSTVKTLYTKSANQLYRRHIHIYAGSGGGGGEAGQGTDAGAGGRGGGGLYIECAGELNFTGTISVSGLAGGAGQAGGAGSAGAGGGGGGSTGSCVLLYNYLTANSGTISALGGAGGTGGSNVSGGDTGGSTRCHGGGGAGSYTSAGGTGANENNAGGAGGNGAGGGGGGGNVAGGGTTSGGSAGGSEGGLVAKNIYLD